MNTEFSLDSVFAARRAEFGDARMSLEAGQESGGESGGEISQGAEQPTGDSSGGGNPAWDEILKTLPDGLHPVVRPALEKWDRNYQQGIQKVHSQYEPYKPFIEAGYDPQSIQYALTVLDKLENDPRSIYDSLGQYHGWANGEQGQPESELGEGEEGEEGYTPSDDPRLLRAEQLSEAVAQYVMEQHEQQQQAAEDEALDAEISQLKEKHGIGEDDEVAERFVMGLMLAGASAEEAFTEYTKMQSTVATRPRANSTAPAVLGSGGSVPSAQVPVSQLRTGQGRKALVAQILQQQE